MTDWDKQYMQIKDYEIDATQNPHWGWQALGMVLAMLVLAWAGAWIAEGLA